MAALQPGTYRGRTDGLDFEFRIECTPDGEVCIVSGDILRGDRMLASMICDRPSNGDGRTVFGPVVFRGHPDLFTGTLRIDADPRGVGTFQLGVDLEGGHRDQIAGRLDWQGSFARRLFIEIDGVAGASAPGEYLTRTGGAMTVQRAFESAGFDVQVRVDRFAGGGHADDRARGWTLAEIHAAMTERRDPVPPDRMHAHVFVCSYLAGRNGRNVLGVMYDFGADDLNRRPREGVAVFYDHPMLSDPRVPQELRDREYVFTLVHEIGHALNLMHSFDKARPASLSWMNYPHLFPRGKEASPGYDGTGEFWRRFTEVFDEDELRHLRHATPREIRAGGFPFGVYEEGLSRPFGGHADPRLTRLGSNPLREVPGVGVKLETTKGGEAEYELGEPVFLSVQVSNMGADPVHVPDALDPSEGYLRLDIITPRGREIRYRPPVTQCAQAPLVHLPEGEALHPYDGVPLFLGSDGPVFTEPGVYRVRAELTGIDGGRMARSEWTSVHVRSPDRETERFAHALWDRPETLETLYLRHPLANLGAWQELEESLRRAKLRPGNTTPSYVGYTAALGWLTPFRTVSGRTMDAQRERALTHLREVEPAGLPGSVGRRVQELQEEIEAESKEQDGLAKQSVFITARAGGVTPLREEEVGRAEVSPLGLFGAAGLQGDLFPGELIDPFVRIVPTLRGTRRFADVVSWNIEHMHRRSNWPKIPKIAELIRGFRCDFWGLQEVDAVSMAKLVESLNSTGRTRYDMRVVDGKQQQSAALFRTDTTSIRVRRLPSWMLEEKVEVQLAGAGAKKEKRAVFLREPLVCDVAVKQDGAGVFDFTCAIVHLKSTDAKLKDKGAAMRARAAELLVEWMRAELASGSERDFIILGDMNAETAQQGLGRFARDQDLRLLSVGMQDAYGREEALTRVASKRLLDHIVVTDDSFQKMPREDKDEQIIVRSDTRLANWTKAYSDHVPVAVRFVLGEDAD